MNYQHLATATLFCIFSLTSMESPFELMLDECMTPEETKSLYSIETKEQAIELFDTSHKMLQQYHHFLALENKAVKLTPFINPCLATQLPELTEWKKKTACLSMAFAILGNAGLSLQHLFDQKLNDEDSSSSHSESIALRKKLTHELAAYNKDFRKSHQALQKAFDEDLQNITFTKFLTIKELKTRLSEFKGEADPQLFFLCDYILFLKNHSSDQINFFKCALIIQRILEVPTREGMPPTIVEQLEAYPKENVLQFCTSHLPKLEREMLTELQQCLTSLKPYIGKATNGKISADLYQKMLQDNQKENRENIKKLPHYRALLSKKFMIQYERKVSELDHLLNTTGEQLKKEQLSEDSIIPLPAIPVCPLDVMPHSVGTIQELKTRYKYCVPFRLKHPMLESRGNTTTSLLYFFSNGSFITKGLVPTTQFVFQSNEKMFLLEQDTDVKQHNTALCFAVDGNYYFVNRMLKEEPRGFKVDYIAALSLPKQQKSASEKS